MTCTVYYGFGANRTFTKEMTVADAFTFAKTEGKYFPFCNIFFNGNLVYTTSGLAGYAFTCDDCPYC